MSMNNVILFKEFLSFLSLVSFNSHANKMTPSNLAIVQAPNLLRCGTGELEDISNFNIANQVVDFLISNSEFLFNKNVNLYRSVVALFDDTVLFKTKLVGHKKSIRLICPTKKRRLWSIDSDGTIFSWNFTGCLLSTFSTNCKQPFCFELIKDNIWIGHQNGLSIFNSISQDKVGEIPHFAVYSVLNIPNSDLVWAGCDGLIKVLSATTFLPCEEIVVPDNLPIIQMCIVDDTVWCCAMNQRKGDILIYDINSKQLLNHFTAHDKKINHLLKLGNYVWSCSDDFSICIWDSKSYSRIKTLKRHTAHVNQLCWVGDQVWSCSWDKKNYHMECSQLFICR